MARSGGATDVDHDRRQVDDAFEGQAGEVGAVGVPVGRRVHVGAGVGDHVDAPDVELGARRVDGAARLAAQVVA